MGEAGRILIVGIGNLIWAGKRFGVRAAARHDLSRSAPLMDRGTQAVTGALSRLQKIAAVCADAAADIRQSFDLRGLDAPSRRAVPTGGLVRGEQAP